MASETGSLKTASSSGESANFRFLRRPPINSGNRSTGRGGSKSGFDRDTFYVWLMAPQVAQAAIARDRAGICAEGSLVRRSARVTR